MTMTEESTTAPNDPAPVEVVSREAPKSPALVERNEAITVAAESALAMPGVPGRDEFLTLAMTAKMLSLSGAAPKAVQNNPYVAFHVAMVGRDLGISPSAAIELIDVMESGGKTTLSLSPQLLNGQIRRLGLGVILQKVATNERCVATAVGPDGIDRRCRLTWRNDVHADDCRCDILGEYEFTWEDAILASLAMPDCRPGAHTTKCKDFKSKWFEKCNQGYVTYPKRMLWWRASGFCADDYFPEAGLGLYTAEELGAVIDADGRPIDPANVDLPDGYEPPPKAIPAATEGADPDVLWDLQVRVAALPDAQRADLRARWEQMEALHGRKLGHLNVSQAKLVDSLVKGLESRARADGWDKDEARGAIEATVVGNLMLFLTPGRSTAPTSGDKPDVPMSSDAVAEAAGEPAVVEDAERVKAMKLDDVRGELAARTLNVEGNSETLRKRLTIALLKERLAAPKAGS